MVNTSCIDNSSGDEMMKKSKNALQGMLCLTVCGLLFAGIMLTHTNSDETNYSQIINNQKAKQAFAMRADISHQQLASNP